MALYTVRHPRLRIVQTELSVVFNDPFFAFPAPWAVYNKSLGTIHFNETLLVSQGVETSAILRQQAIDWLYRNQYQVSFFLTGGTVPRDYYRQRELARVADTHGEVR